MTGYNVVVKMRILPPDVETSMEKIIESVEKIVDEYGKLHSHEIQPIAFGLSALEVNILLVDSEGGMDEMEAKINDLDNVGEVEVVDLNRL